MEPKVYQRKPIPDGGYGWIVLFASFFISFLLDGIMYTFNLILNPIKTHYGSTETEMNMITGLNTGFLFCSGPIVAGLTNTFGCRQVIMAGAMVTATLYFLCSLAPSIYLIWVYYGIIGGISTGCTYISSLIVIAEYFDKKVGTATGIVMSGSGLGSVVAPLLFGRLVDMFDWKFTMIILSCLITLCCILAAFLTPLNPPGRNYEDSSKPVELKLLEERTDKELQESICHEEKMITATYMGSMCSLAAKKQPFYVRNSFLKLTIQILKEMTNFSLLTESAPYAMIVISNFFLFMGFFLPYNYMVRIAEKNGMTNAENLLMLVGFLNIPFRLLFGLIADRRYLTPINLNTLCVFIPTVPFLVYPTILQKHTWGHYTFASCFAIGTAGMNSLTTAYLLDIVPIEKFGNATGIVNLFRGFGCFIGPYFGGMIADNCEDIAYVFYFSGLCYIVGLTFTAMSGFWLTLQKCFSKEPQPEVIRPPNRDINNNESGKTFL